MILGAFLVISLSGIPGEALGDQDWYVSLYGARLTGDTLGDTVRLDASYENSYFFVLSAGRKLFQIKDLMKFEAEVQVAKHFGEQHNWEFNGLVILRWVKFPWNNFLKTSFAVGDGLSYATEPPEVEERHHDDTSRLLDYLMFEVSASLPDDSRWEVFTRIHHRSGAFGLFNGVTGASNAIGLGIRYHF